MKNSNLPGLYKDELVFDIIPTVDMNFRMSAPIIESLL